MYLKSSDNVKHINIGKSDIWISLLSTVEVRLYSYKKNIPLALQFLKKGKCDSKNALETARQINLIRDQFSKYSPDMVIYDVRNIELKAPWINNLSPVVTSCANLFTTADGEDLLFEIVKILVYADIEKVSVFIE